MKDSSYMSLALLQAEQALEYGEVPIGCVLVDSEDNLLSQGSNSPIKQHDPTAHAEIICIRQACQGLHNYRLPVGCTLYVTLEPCLMCTGALLQARLSRLVIGARDSRKNSIHQHIELFQSPYFNHKITVIYGCLEEEARLLLNKFFMERR